MTETQHIDPPYRWVIVVAASLILAGAMGQLVNGLSVYVVPLEAAFGWDRGEIALINTVGLIGIALGGILMGRLADRVSIRPLALMGVTLTGLACLAASQATQLWQFYGLFFIGGLLGGGALFAPLMALVGTWFSRGAGLAIGIASAGQAMGQGGMPFTGGMLIEAIGWRGALATQGAAILVLLIPLALLLRDPPKQSKSQAAAAGPQILPNRIVTIWLSAAIICCCTCMSVPLMHLVPYMQACGIPVTEAGSVLFLLLLVAILGRVAFGRYADMVGPVPAYFTASLWQTVLVFGFMGLVTLETLYPYAALYGFGYAGVMTSVLVTARTLTDPRYRASSMGIILAFGWFGHGLGGWQGGVFYDLTGDYTVTFAVAAIAGALNLALVGALWVTVMRRQRELGELAPA